MRARSLLVLGVVGLGILGHATPAPAQSNFEAEQLFREGKRLMNAQRYAEACEAFASSDRLEPNVSTQVSLADCHERRGKLATAWGLFLAVAAQTRKDVDHAAVHAVAAARAAALEPRLPYLTISVADASKVDGLEVTRNGVTVDPGVWNHAVPIDLGTYVVRARAPGRAPWSTTVVVDGEGVQRTVDVPRFEPALAAGGDQAAPRELRGGAPPRRRRPSWMVPGGLAAAAVALGGVALGFELSGRRSYDAYARAPGRDDLYEQANRKHHLAQGAAIAGVGCAAAAVAVMLWQRRGGEPPRTALVPAAGGGVAGLALAGAF